MKSHLIPAAMIFAVLGAEAASADDYAAAQGRVVESGAAVLDPRERVEPENRMVSDRLENLLPRAARPC